MRPRRVFLLSLNALAVLAVLTTMLLGPLPISVASAHPRSAGPFATTAALSGAYGLSAQALARAALLDATTPPCNAFPIALNIATLAGAQVGDTLGDIYNGTTPGNFGWLSWTGDPSEPTLVTSLTLPGNSATYVNPTDPTDHTLAVGDWVSGKPGVSNSKAVRDALTALEGIDLTVPVWDQAQGSGTTSQYHVIGFVQVQITAFQLAGANRITATYLGNTPCGGGTLPPPAGPSLSGATLTLSPSAAGPNITGTTQTLTATLKSHAGVPIPDIAVQFTISGPNAAMSNGATTNSEGVATYTYEGDASGTDSIQATATSNGTTVTSNTASVSWLTPTQPVSSTTIWARVFPADGSGQFNATPTQTPAFTQAVPTIDFNPPANTIPGNTSGVTEFSRPMVDVTTDLNGNYTGTIVLQGNGLQAGVGSLFFFNVVFTGTLTVSAAGDVTFNFFTDDGFVLGVGNGATRVSGPLVNPPASGLTAFEQFPTMGAYNIATAPVGNLVTVHFPGPGSYPYELDYSEGICCQLVVTATTVTASGIQGIAPTGSLTLSPNSVPTQPAGTQQSFTVTATDASGAVLPNLPVQLTVTGANPQQLQATTDASGNATFSYTAALAGTDTLQALAWVSNLASYSNQVTVPWSAPTSPPPTPPVATPGWIGSPTSQSTQTGSVSIKLASGITLTSGTVDYWPTADSSQVTTLATNVSGTGGATLATLDTTTLANGSYIVRLQGTNSSGTQLNSEVLITVVGQNKPGRVTFSVTDLTVPVVGLPITIGRTYDSLLRNQSGDFGNGWNLTIGTPKLTVDPAHNVTLTLADGRRVTFFFTPQSVGGIFGFLLTPGYTAEAGVFGSLVAQSCGLLTVSGGQEFCFPGTLYQPTAYTYTDPYGRVYVFDATTGALTSVTDLDGNTLTFTQSSITSSAGNVQVSFTRDSAGRITQITDPAGNVYQYSYNAGNLVGVTLPVPAGSPPITIQYSYYATTNLLNQAIDPRGYQSAITHYDSQNRLQSVTDAGSNTTTYAYPAPNTTAVTAPDGGTTTYTYDALGDLLSQTDPLGDTTSYTYDSQRNLMSVTDPLGHITRYTYDSQGNRTSMKDPLGNIISATYNPFSGPTTLTDAHGTRWSITYDALFHPISVTDDLGAVGGYTWDDHGQVLAQTDGNGQTTTSTYDQYGNLLTQTDPLGGETYYTYDSLGRKTSSIDALGHKTTYTYDPLGHLLTVTDPLGHVTTYTYDANGNQTSVKDANGHTITYAYDALNRLTLTTYPDHTTTSTTYDFRGNPLTQTDQSNNVTTSVYTLLGQLSSVTTATNTTDAATISYLYDAAGRKMQVTDPLGNITINGYDDAGHLTSVKDPLGNITRYTYNENGQQASVTDANGHTTSYTYDIRGRLTRTTYQDQTFTQQSYDGQGNLLSSTDQAGKVTNYSYDAIGQLLSITNPLQQATSYTYDAVGNLLTITDANGHTTSYAYDADNRQTKQTWPDGSFETFGYDAVGNQTSHQLTDGHTNTSTYDVMNRLSKLTYFDGTSVSYTYTPTGQQATVTDGRGTEQYTYDHQDRLIQLITPTGQTISYSYDAAGNRTDMTTPAGGTSYSYDADNRLSSVSAPGVGVFSYGYDAVGNQTHLTLPNGITENSGYDTLNRLTSVTQTLGSQTLASYTYTLDPAGNRTKVVNADGSSTSWTYDDAYRLTGETDTGASGTTTYQASYTYDGVGNRTTATIDGQTITYSYNSLDQLTSVGNTTYSYDGRGNLVKAQNGSSVTYTYNAANQLTSATEPSGVSVSYAYDAAGRRVQQTVGSSVTNYLWDEASTNGSVVLETDGSGATQASYVLSDDQVLAQTRSGASSYYLYDGQGSVRDLTNSSGTITDQYTYDAFGNLLSSTGSTINPYRYTGQQFDALTGLYDLRARYYDPTTGQFTSRDTVAIDVNNPVELNRYSYAEDNPIDFSDPSGHQAFAEYAQLIKTALIGGLVLGAALVIAHNQEQIDQWIVELMGAIARFFEWLFSRKVPIAVPISVPYTATPTSKSCPQSDPAQAEYLIYSLTYGIDGEVRGPEGGDLNCHVNVQVESRSVPGPEQNYHVFRVGSEFEAVDFDRLQKLTCATPVSCGDILATIQAQYEVDWINSTTGRTSPVGRSGLTALRAWFKTEITARLTELLALY